MILISHNGLVSPFWMSYEWEKGVWTCVCARLQRGVLLEPWVAHFFSMCHLGSIQPAALMNSTCMEHIVHLSGNMCVHFCCVYTSQWSWAQGIHMLNSSNQH